MKRHPFKMSLPKEVTELANIFHSVGHELYVVGGSVRDALLGSTPKDYDFVTPLHPEQTKQLLAGHGIKTLLVGESFGVVVAVMPSGEQVEIATARVDIGEGRRPESVEFCSIEQDAQRRDITFNALYYDIAREEILDFVGGLEDLHNNVIRTVGRAEDRFREDRLRVLRAVRFAARMCAELDNEIVDAIKRNPKLVGVSPERVRDEFLKGLKTARNVLSFYALLDELELWPEIFAGLTVHREPLAFTAIPHISIATLLRGHNHLTVEKHLKKKCAYSVGETTKIAFLIKFLTIGVETVSELKKMWCQMNSSDNLRLTEQELRLFASINGIDENLVDRFLAVVSFTAPIEKLMEQGFKNAELGKELTRLDKEAFGHG